MEIFSTSSRVLCQLQMLLSCRLSGLIARVWRVAYGFFTAAWLSQKRACASRERAIVFIRQRAQQVTHDARPINIIAAAADWPACRRTDARARANWLRDKRRRAEKAGSRRRCVNHAHLFQRCLPPFSFARQADKLSAN